MFFMYVDESGDCGLLTSGSPSRFFCLTGLVVHELRWHETLSELSAFRRHLWRAYRIHINDEIHTAELINKPSRLASSLSGLSKYNRLGIIRQFADAIARIPDISFINVCVDKESGRFTSQEEVFRKAWYCLLQRFENTIDYGNFPGPCNPYEKGIVLPDNTDRRKLRHFLNEMRINNFLKIQETNTGGAFRYENRPIRIIIEDPIVKDSKESYFIQAADCVTYLFKQYLLPSAYIKKHGGHAYFKRLDKVLCKQATMKDPAGLGIVRL